MLLTAADHPPLKNEPAEEAKPANSNAATSNAQPLAPPPRPAQGAASDAPDYFNQLHNPTQFSLEPNPFEQSFGNPSAETPGKSILPPVASITSPSPLQGVTPGWSSLRSGPLSPAMLAGPQNSDYFSESFRGGFPTPNESSLRTGLTPGGGGSMFPAPSPNSQALFNLQSGGATPSTLDFHRTALSAAQANTKFSLPAGGPTSQPPEQSATAQAGPFPAAQNQAQGAQTQAPGQRGQQDILGSAHDVNTAANDLLQFSSGARNGIFAVPTQPTAVNASIPMQGQVPQSQESSPTTRRGTKGSIGTSISAGSVEPADQSDSGQSEQAKPASRSRAKKAANNKTQANRRKAEETPVKAPASKKHKNNPGTVSPDEDDDSDMETSPKDGLDANGKKMTDEEKRKNFLERNR
jgi:ATF/CREB family transcription factor